LGSLVSVISILHFSSGSMHGIPTSPLWTSLRFFLWPTTLIPTTWLTDRHRGLHQDLFVYPHRLSLPITSFIFTLNSHPQHHHKSTFATSLSQPLPPSAGNRIVPRHGQLCASDTSFSIQESKKNQEASAALPNQPSSPPINLIIAPIPIQPR
jgi:hypothetical protein